MRRLASCLLVSLLLLGGCGPLPRPFQPDRKSFVQARDLPDEAQVAVAPLSEDAPGAAQRAAAALARSLENYGISTAAEGLPAATALAGRAEVEAADSGRDAIAITWELSGSEGEVVAIFHG